jgi:hypothetical protein
MSIFTKQDPLPVLVVRDVHQLVLALRGALGEASEEERPGLERALALAVEVEASSDEELGGRWALRRVEDAGFTGALDSVSAVKALRDAEPGLSLRQAVALMRQAVAAEKTDAAGPATT